MSIDFSRLGERPKKPEPKKFEPLPPGAYVCQIVDARITNDPLKGCLLSCDIDIVEGEKSFYFHRRLPRTGEWDFNAVFKRYVWKGDGKPKRSFWDFIDRLEKHNPNFKFDKDDFEPEQLRGLRCGFTFGEREYLASDGQIRTVTCVKFDCDLEKVRQGKVKTPEIEKYDRGLLHEKPEPEIVDKQNDSAEFNGTDVDEMDLPF